MAMRHTTTPPWLRESLGSYWAKRLVSGAAGMGRALIGFWIATSLMLYQITAALFVLALQADGLRWRFGLHLIAAIAAGAIVAIWSYRRKASRLNLLSAAGVGLSVAVLVLGVTLWSSLFADDITELPGAISASVFFPGCAIVAGTVVFLIFWSVRVISSGLWRFARGPERRIELMRLMKGMVGAVAVAALAAAVQFAKGEHVSAFTISEVYYAIIVPAVVAFGFFGPALVGALVAGLTVSLRSKIRSRSVRLRASVLTAGFFFVLIEGAWLTFSVLHRGRYSAAAGVDLLKIALLLVADAAVAFSLLWTARCLLGAGFGGERLAKSSWKGALIGAALAATIALTQGAPPLRFVFSDWFYGLLVPALVGMAWANRGPREPSRLLGLALLGSAGVIAASAVPVPFIERDYVDCQPWKAEHQVLDVGGIPLIEWDLRE